MMDESAKLLLVMSYGIDVALNIAVEEGLLTVDDANYIVHKTADKLREEHDAAHKEEGTVCKDDGKDEKIH